MDHADNIVEIVAVYRNPAVPVLGENIDEVAERGAFLNRNYIGTRYRDIVYPIIAEMQHVPQHLEFQR